MVLLAQICVPVLRQFPSTLWGGRNIYMLEIIGSVKRFDYNDTFIILKEPVNNLSLMHIYKKQQEIMHVIAQGIEDIQEENDDAISCNNCVHVCFEDDYISSTLQIRASKDLLHPMKEIFDGQTIKSTCLLGYDREDHSLILRAQSIEIASTVEVIVK